MGFLGFVAAFTVFGGLAGCDEKSEEPEAGQRAPVTTLPPLRYRVPEGWIAGNADPQGTRRGVFKLPSLVDGGEEVEILVLYFGAGSSGDRDKQWDEWLSGFQGDPKSTWTRDDFRAGSSALPVETFMVTGTYRIGLGKKPKGLKVDPVSVLKDRFTMFGAVVRTTDRGNWFLRVLGPAPVVAAHTAEIRAFLDSVE